MLWMPPWPPTRPTAQSVWPRGRARPTAARAAQGATKQLLTMTGPESSTHGIALADFPGCCCGPTQLPIRHGRCVFLVKDAATCLQALHHRQCVVLATASPGQTGPLCVCLKKCAGQGGNCCLLK